MMTCWLTQTLWIRASVCVVALILAAGVIGTLIPVSAAADAPLFQKGQTYAVAWDCWPEWVAQFASAQFAGGQPLGACYAEYLTVRQVRADGWLMVTDEDGHVWSVNPARMIGFMPKSHGVRAD